jgi:hypothetical protein
LPSMSVKLRTRSASCCASISAVRPPTECPTRWNRRMPAWSSTACAVMQAGDYLNTALVFSGIIMIAIIALVLDACLRGLLLLADPSRRR